MRDTPDIAGGVIVRDAKGKPTGILKKNPKTFAERSATERRWQRSSRPRSAATAGPLGCDQVPADGSLGHVQQRLGMPTGNESTS
jgi:predicted amidohydrolase YtcJ